MADLNVHRSITLGQVKRLISSQKEIKDSTSVGELFIKEGLMTLIIRFEQEDLNTNKQ